MIYTKIKNIFLLAIFFMLPNFVLAVYPVAGIVKLRNGVNRRKSSLSLSFIIVFFSLHLVSPAYGAPAVSGINGTVLHNDTITVNGVGFGIKSPVAPLMWDPVDGMYTGITNGGEVPTGASYPWRESSGTIYPVHFKTTNPRGKWTAKYTNTGSTNVVEKAGLGSHDYPPGEWLIGVWWMWLADTSACHGTGGSDKYTRWLSSDFADTVIVAPSMSHIYVTSGGDTQDGLDMCGIIGQWQRMEQAVENTEYIKLFKYLNSQPHGNIIPLISNYASDPMTQVMIGLDASNDEEYDRPTIDWGEIYLDNTRARVEICNTNNKSTSNHCEIQIPETSWNTNQLQIKINQGSFADNSSQYLYVLDSTGTANVDGFPITFGSGGTSDTTAPEAPHGLAVQ